jgi:hypothetical protein
MPLTTSPAWDRASKGEAMGCWASGMAAPGVGLGFARH